MPLFLFFLFASEVCPTLLCTARGCVSTVGTGEMSLAMGRAGGISWILGFRNAAAQVEQLEG